MPCGLVDAWVAAAWFVGTAGLSVAKILENMELGHNIMHGQWDWMRDPKIHSTTWEWDMATPARDWQHSHNELHHTYTNVIGKDNDLGYGIARVDEEQPWHPMYLGQPLWNFINAVFFEYGIAAYDLELGATIKKKKLKDPEFQRRLKGVLRKIRKQATKDYVVHPALSIPTGSFLPTLAANFTANVVRNLWSNSIILCGHFPEGVETFEKRSIEGETKGEWYLRQMLGAAIKKKKTKDPEFQRRLKGVLTKIRKQATKDYLVHPALSIPTGSFLPTLAANFTANVVRNLWSNSVILCGHFPEGVETFEKRSIDGETKGEWYLRQMLGAANISGGPAMHLMSGNLSHQIEHHLFPDLPSNRYAEIAPKVQALFEKYDLNYHSAPLPQQVYSAWHKVVRLSLPNGWLAETNVRNAPRQLAKLYKMTTGGPKVRRAIVAMDKRAATAARDAA